LRVLPGGAIFAWFASLSREVVGTSFGLKLQDEREYREVVLGAESAIIIFGMLALWKTF